MNLTAKPARVILRAELRESSCTIVGSAFELTPSSVFVATDREFPVGTNLALTLSFANLLPTIALSARVEDRRAAGGPGELAGVRLAFEPSAQERVLLDGLIARVHAPIEHAGAAFRVLVVEDSRLIRDMFALKVSQFFAEPGVVEIEFADDAVTAWLMLAQSSFDLLIVDHYLPAETGASLNARLRADARLARMPIVAMSVGGSVARDASLSAGADLFLDKPLVLRDLFNTMRVLLQRDELNAGGGNATAGRRILVFDDSPFVLALTRAGLEAAGFEVAIAEDLASFEAQRASFAPDLILVDVQMPEAFGDDVAATLTAWHQVQIPILLVSSLDESELAQRAREARTGYVSKSAGMGELVRRCRELLGAE
jgi:DNA-binding response OmpR family regulator